MKYVLFIAETPTTPDKAAKLEDLHSRMQALSSSHKGIQVLNVGTYVLNIENGLQDLASLVHQASGRELEFRTLFFAEAPQWIRN